MEITCGSEGASVPPPSDIVTLVLSQVWCSTVSPVDTPVLPSDHPCSGASGLEHFPWMGNKDSSLGRIIIKLTWGWVAGRCQCINVGMHPAWYLVLG